MKPKIKAVIFDLGGVIMSGGYLPFLKHYCLAALTPEGKKIIDGLEHQVNLGKITEQQFYKKIRSTFGVHLTPQQMQKIIVSKMRVNKSLIKFIAHIKPAKVALFTNSIGYMAAHVLHARNVPTRKIFGRMFLSNKIHLAKPDARAYEYVASKLDVLPQEIIMVDDRAENITAAKKIGMQGILFKNTAQFEREIKKFELVHR